MLAVAAIHTIALILIGPIGIGYAPVVWSWDFAIVVYAWIYFGIMTVAYFRYGLTLVLAVGTFWPATNFESVLVVGRLPFLPRLFGCHDECVPPNPAGETG